MKTIQAVSYPVHFQEESYQELSNLIDQNLQNSFASFLMSSTNISESEANSQMSEIQDNAMNIINSQDPEIQKRLDLIEEIDPQELNEELQYLIKELSTNQYSAEEQMEISNSLFNIFGFNIELDENNEVQINLTEPTIDELDDDYDDDLDDIYEDFETFDSAPAYQAAPAAPVRSAAPTQTNNRKFEDFDFDY